LLALSLSFNVAFLALSQPASSAPAIQNSSDQEALRALTEKYGATIAASDLEGMRRLWDPQSPNLDARLKFYQGVFTNIRVEFASLNVTRLEVTGDKAVSHLTTDERQLDKRTGTGRALLHGTCRALEWVKTDAGWKIEREYKAQDALAARLEAAASDQERDELLAKEQVLVTDSLSDALITRGQQSQMRVDYEKALRSFRLAQAVSEKIGAQEGVGRALNKIGIVKRAQYDCEQAMLAHQKALAIFEAVGVKSGAAAALEGLNQLYYLLGDYQEAFDCARKSLQFYEEVGDTRGIASALTKIGDLYGIQNNPQQALAHFERAMKISEELEDRYRIAILRSGMAEAHLAMGDYEQALELFQAPLRQIESHGDQAGAAIIRIEVGRVYAAQGLYEKALDYYRQALAVLEAGNRKRAVATALGHMSDAYLADGKFADALPIAERVVSMTRQLGQPFDLWSALAAAGYCQLALKRPAEARKSFSEAVTIIERLRTQAAGDAEDSQRYFENGLRAHHGLLHLLVRENQTREALSLAERAKARTLLDALQRGRVSIQKAMTAEEREQERRLKLELAMLNIQMTRITQSGKPDPHRVGEIEPRLEKARLDYEAFQTSLYATHPELRARRGDAPIINAEELATLIHAPNRAMLEYVVTDDATYLFAVTKAADRCGADVQVFTLPIKRAELAGQVESFRRSLAERDLGFRDAARRLYDLLLKPAQAQLRGKTDLVIAPDDRLWELPFQALLAGDDRYVLEKSAVSYAPSLTVLREMAKARKRGAETSRTSLLAFGNPALGKETMARAAQVARDESLDPLPEAEAEVKSLGRLYGAARSKIYVGAEAREDRAKNEAGAFQVLHFATHGVLNNAAPMYSHLVLAQGDKNEDGLLEAWELMQMDLHADLAVLSACETARGRFGAGEGVIGLTWALFVAGTPATVVSQWKVESASSRELMLGFHRNLRALSREPAPKAEALRQAALKLMKNPSTSHPFYWAGFVLVGDGR
jgi:CHAT domain-containing protein